MEMHEMKQYPPPEMEYGPPGHHYPPEGVRQHQGVGYMPAHKVGSPHAQGNQPTKEEERLQCLKYTLFTYNLVMFLCGCVLLGIGIWMAVDRNFMTYIIGNDMYAVAIYFILAAGGIIFIISFLGCCGSISENKCMLFVFMIVLIVLVLLCIVGGILAIVFRTQIGDSVKDTMTKTLKERYGVNFNERFNRLVTDAWDRAQERLHCCAVTERGWSVYQESEWFGMQVWNPEDQKPYVPQSCCVKDRFWRYINKDVCQKWRLGPPGSPVDGAINRALYYDGCYDAGVTYLYDNSVILIALGLIVGILLIGGVILSFMVIRQIPNEEK